MAEITPLSEGVSPERPDRTGSAFTLPTFSTLPPMAFPTFGATAPTGFTNSPSSFLPSLTLTLTLTLPTFNNPSLTEFSGPPTTRSSDPATLPTSKNLDPTGLSGPATTLTLTLPTFNNPSHSGFSGPATTYLTSLEHPAFSPSGLPGPQTTGFSAPVSSVLTAYDPVSTVAFSRLQSSFSVIGVGSSILTAEVFLYGAYLVMFGFYLNVLRVHGTARNRSLTVATALLFIFYIALLRNLEFPTENNYLSHTSDCGCCGCGLHQSFLASSHPELSSLPKLGRCRILF
ncbi:hypothetical protein B0H11DRAFT_1014934 [Mycena galericulata]|nr:hypothetical protein B0H11DRAFT_1014934 [Mycena galericulata]